MKKVYMSKVNGVGENGTKIPPRFVLERNVLDMLERNEHYGNLGFCDAQIVTENATVDELLAIYEYELDPKAIDEILNRG